MRLFLLHTILAFSAHLTAQDHFNKYYPFESHVSGFQSLLIENDTVLLQGFIKDTISPFLQGLIFAKVDSSGDLISNTRYYDPFGRDLVLPPLNNMIKLSNGNFVTVAMTFQEEAVLVVFLDRKFEIDTVFEYFTNDQSVRINAIRSVFETEDGFLIFGSAQRLNYNVDGQILRINDTGSIVWRQFYGWDDKDEFFGDVIPYSDSTFIVGSFRKPFPAASNDKRRNTWIFEVDLDGNIRNEFLDPDIFSGTSGGFVIDEQQNIYYTGASFVEGLFSEHNALRRLGMLNMEFQLQWKREYGKNLSINTGGADMILSNNKLISIGTHVDTFTLPGSNQRRPHLGWTFVSTTSGDSLCERFDTAMWYWSISSIGSLRAIDTLSSGSIVACGDGRFGPEDDHHEYASLVKMPNPPCEGITVSNKEIHTDLTETITVFPNPARDAIFMEWEESISADVDFISVFDTEGRLMKKMRVLEGDKSLVLPLANQLPGVYLVQLVSKGGYLLGIKKFVVE